MTKLYRIILATFFFFMITACGHVDKTPQNPVPVQTQIVVIGPDPSVVRRCSEYVRGRDVPDPDTATNAQRDSYTRHVEDGYEYCRDGLVATHRNAEKARAESETR
jgi:hypothetical protein